MIDFLLSGHDLWIIATAILVACNAASIGVFVMLRKMSMLGDAVSHSVLLGLVGAFLITGVKSPSLLFLGALVVALATGYITMFLSGRLRVHEDASIGVSFTWMFALGVILLSAYAGQIDLDQDCVLYGEIAFVPFDQITLFDREIGPRAFWSLFGASVCLSGLMFAGRRAFSMLAFDRSFAICSGVSIRLWDFLLLSALAFVVVSAFESVGAILVIALLSIPAASAYLFAKSQSQMLVLANLHGILASICGFYLAKGFDASIAASIAVVAGSIFSVELVSLTLFRKFFLRSEIRCE
jgi:manganese/zinc/iron transport system permease protein